MDETLKRWYAKLSRLGGKARVAGMSKEERRALARKAAQARWAKKRPSREKK